MKTRTSQLWHEGERHALAYLLGVLTSDPDISGKEAARMLAQHLAGQGELGWVIEDSLRELGILQELGIDTQEEDDENEN